jgi:hypothetical protein
MFRRPLVLSPRRSTGFLAAWEAYDPKAASPLSDFALQALLQNGRGLQSFPSGSGKGVGKRPEVGSSFSDRLAAAVTLGLLGITGLIIAWVLLVP